MTAGCGLETWASPCLGAPQNKVLFSGGHGIHTTHYRARSPLCILGVSGQADKPEAPLEGHFAFTLHFWVGGGYRGIRSSSEGQLKVGEREQLTESCISYQIPPPDISHVNVVYIWQLFTILCWQIIKAASPS